MIASSWKFSYIQGCRIAHKQPHDKNNTLLDSFGIVMLNEVKHLGLEQDLRYALFEILRGAQNDMVCIFF